MKASNVRTLFTLWGRTILSDLTTLLLHLRELAVGFWKTLVFI